MKQHGQQNLRSKKRRGRAHLDAVNAARRAQDTSSPEAAERFNDWDASTFGVSEVADVMAAPRTPLATDPGYVEQRGNNIIAFFDDNWKPTREAFATRARLWYPDGRVQLLALDPPDTNDVARTPREVILPDTESAQQ